MKTYLVYDGRFFKIGKSTNIESRFKSIKAHNPSSMLLCVSDKDIESYLHNKYSENRIYNEWFMFNEEEIKSVRSEFNIVINHINESDSIDGLKIKDNFNLKSKKDNQSNGSFKSSNRRSNQTFNNLYKLWYEHRKNNLKITQLMLSELSGKSIATVKRHWVKIQLENKL